MDKILVAVFDDESAAYKGLNALKDIHNDGDISLYEAAVVRKDSSGEISVKETIDTGPVGTALGMLTGSMVGLLGGGPAGAVAGASLGGLTGMLADLATTGVDINFIDEISSALTPGKVAVIADIDETWVIPVELKMHELGGQVYRRLRSEIIDDQLTRQYTEFNAELNQLETELKQATSENKAAIQKHIDSDKKKITAIRDQVKVRMEKLRAASEAKITSLKEQIKKAKEDKKATIEKRIDEIKTDFNARSTKLKQAQLLAKEALFGSK